MILELIVTFLLVVANGFFVATEFAITRMRPAQVTDLEGAGRAGAGSVRHAVDHIDAYLAACQLGITMASLGLGVVGERVFHDLLEGVLGDQTRIFSIGLAGLFAFLIITLLHVVLGELAPKSLALSRTQPISLAVATPMRIFYTATKPLVDLFNGLGNLVLKPFGIPPAREAGHAPASEDELRTLIGQSSEQGLIDAQEQRFADNVFSFGDRRAREIMVPRPEVTVLTVGEGGEAAARHARGTGYTRFPLCEDDGGLDAVVGLLNVKDLLTAPTGLADTDLRELARPLPRISDATLVNELLRELRRSRQHMALVVDEHGTGVGVVTLEDVLEEIVGEIEDEFDPPGAELVRREGETVVIDGTAPLRLVQEELGIELADAHEATIGGHVVEGLGRLPRHGETVELGGRSVEVTGVGEARVQELRAEAVSRDGGDGGDPGAASDGARESGGREDA
ncbi:MAG: Magnesium and cobalt efflux protein CorC [uncultured Solirubrobacterales bacterium]|uniref:Magnesium and cobalt efflux protein CorC n=1 Tax=uncultured Solirubrobacterales bacterium TaxID=768556 RepID=A0A6J4RRE0_9ACTN|nr:MAG: Magnesium and cobalt efflux protein CorC [uncultured Solirubrobacterales bacterium]